MAYPAPSLAGETPANLLANSKHSTIGLSLVSPKAQPPLNESTDTVVSIDF